MNIWKTVSAIVAFISIVGIHSFASPSNINSASIDGIRVTLGENNEVLIDGRPFFPIMQWLQNASSIAKQKGYGFNTFVGQGDNSSALAYCKEAQKQGVYAVPLWNAEQAASVNKNPALLGWVFGDEPDLQSNHISPSRLQTQYNDLKTKDPQHITFLTTTSSFYSEDKLPAWMNGSNAYYHEYPLYSDIIGFDYYPVYGWCRPDWVYRVGQAQAELINNFCGGKKSTFQWIECVKTSSQWCSLCSARGSEDGPFGYELKDEVWLAIATGANAIGYFTHSWKCPGYSQCCLNDNLVRMLIQVNGQIKALTSVLCAADARNPIGVHLEDSKGRVIIRAKEYDGNLYLIAVNVIDLPGARETQQVTFSVPGLKTTFPVYGEKRYISPNEGTFSDAFSKLDPVHIYVIPAAE